MRLQAKLKSILKAKKKTLKFIKAQYYFIIKKLRKKSQNLKIKSLFHSLKIENCKLKILAKRYSHPLIASILLIVLIASFFFIKTKAPSIFAATYYFIQSSWSGGASTTALAIHPTDSTGWTKYQSASSTIIAGANITASTTSSNWADNFSGGAPDSNTYVSGGLINLKKNNGVTCSADQQCTASNCDADFSSGNYCHATASSCVDYALGTPWERATNYALCSGNSYYKLCTDSVWGAQVNCDTTNDYCDAGGGATSGYDLAETCTSKATVGCNATSCTSCSPYMAASTSSCRTSCTEDSHCWSGYGCAGGQCVAPCSASTTCGSSCSYGGLSYGTLTANGKCWMDRNLGATAVATAYNSPTTSYGDYYQWGRKTNGHQVSNSGTSTTQFSAYTQDPTSGGLFIKGFSDWLTPQNNNLWAAAGGYLNNPCPTGWHVPAQAEWASVVSACGITDYTTAISNSCGLKLPASGKRNSDNASLGYQGTNGHYWSSVFNGSSAYSLFFSSAGVLPAYGSYRANGFSVRCVKD